LVSYLQQFFMATVLRPWICDGMAKNNQDYPLCLGNHQVVENFTDICPICFLPREAGKSVFSGSDETRVGQVELNKKEIDDSENIFSLVAFLLRDKSVGVGWRFLILGTILGIILTNLSMVILNQRILGEYSNNLSVGLVSKDGNNFISQGEKIFFEVNPLKRSGADAFGRGHWQRAIALYGEYIEDNGDDYEAQIYQQNAIAHSRGNPLTFAITITGNMEKDINLLSGVARYQKEFNQQPSNDDQRLLEVVIVNYQGADIETLSQNILNANNILGIIDYRLDANSYLALSIYQEQGLGVISPMNIQWKQQEEELQIIEPENRQDIYLTMATQALLNYGNSLNSPPNGIIFYDSQDDDSIKFKSAIIENLPLWQGNVIVEVDVSQNSTPEETLKTVTGANTIVMALGQNRLSEAINIAKENNYFLPILSSENLFNDNTLTEGAEAVDQMVMALPWGFSSDVVVHGQMMEGWNEELVYNIFQEVVSAMTLNPHRGNLNKLLQEGIKLSDYGKEKDSLLQIPLVQIVPDFEGLSENGYKFEFKTIHRK